MEKLTVPQFIENEDKIVAFLSVRQFLIVGIAFGIIVLLYKILSTIPFILGSIVIGGTAAIVAFYKVNGQPFHLFLLNVAQTTQRPSLRVWKKEVSKKEWEAEEYALHQREIEEERARQQSVLPSKQQLTSRRLSELSLIVDTGGAYQGDTQQHNDSL